MLVFIMNAVGDGALPIGVGMFEVSMWVFGRAQQRDSAPSPRQECPRWNSGFPHVIGDHVAKLVGAVQCTIFGCLGRRWCEPIPLIEPPHCYVREGRPSCGERPRILRL
mmetsp:Transcript_42255/g.116573  ORF Transcript_42255/g.116573 Transcript_42255/m.116573 type:complete len:109 (+) Transcript_42255:1864-2190(+)